MTEIFKKGKLVRLEDFIALAREGKDVHVDIELKKHSVARKMHPDEAKAEQGEIDMCLLQADYTFREGDMIQIVSKIYMFGTEIRKPSQADTRLFDESLNKIANERLKVDYERLKDAHITFNEKYF
jgi:hypothetical protein